ncbi:MAG: hypothetical protein IKK66_06740 [Ruminococcus sp.]|nr:hypothetical protein [Ruminococcus sp.]
MKIFKTLLTVIAADILSLFIGLTLAGSSTVIFRVISAICTVGILVCVLGNFAAKTALADIKSARLSKKKLSPAMPLIMSISASFPAVCSWLILRYSHIDFYRWHKIINGYFIQIYNFINPDASSAALTSKEITAMFPLAFVPAAVFLAGYYITYFKEREANHAVKQ